MSALTKKLHTNTSEVRIKLSSHSEKVFSISKDKASSLIKLLSDYEVEETIPWREVLSDSIKNGGEAPAVLRGLRTRESITQQELAVKIKTSQPNVAAFENGTRKIGKEIARKLAKIFNVDYRIFL